MMYARKMNHKPYGFYEQYVKRPQDFVLALVALIVLSPVLLITALLVRIKLGKPVLFCQERPGLNEKIFRLYKFRSMTDERGKDGELLTDEHFRIFSVMEGHMDFSVILRLKG